MNRMTSLIIAAVLIGQTGYDAAVAAAKADYNAHALAKNYSVRYLDMTGPLPQHQRSAVIAEQFWLPHLSRATVLEHSEAVHIGHGMYRVDLDRIGWGVKGWQTLAKGYPYRLDIDPLIIRGDWLMRVTSDTTESTAYYDLLYSGVGTPKNKVEFLKVFGIVEKDLAEFQSGVVLDEGKSGVAFRTRLVAYTPSPGAYYWQSFDSRTGLGAGDPLERLAGGLKSDAQEHIIAMPKFSLRDGERGVVQAYLLTNAKGERQEEAPTDIVVDKQHFLGQPSIRTPGSCVGCHRGLNGPSVNTVRDWIGEGIELTAKSKDTQEFVERFYLSKHGKQITRANEDFATFTQSACGCNPAEAQGHWTATVTRYDAPVTLEQAAHELHCTADELRNAIALYSHKIGPAFNAGRLSSLAHGRQVSRVQWEGSRKTKEFGVYHAAEAALKQWRGK